MARRPDGGALAPLIRALPTPTGVGRFDLFRLSAGASLAVGHADCDCTALTAVALGGRRAGEGAVSRSRAGPVRGALAAGAPCGLDIETLARIAENARADDAWLSCEERAAISGAHRPLLEIGCRWVLKEAYGKALGVGLALPLERLTFARRGRAIALAGATRAGWTFQLFRRQDVLFGVALTSGDAVGTAGQEPARAVAAEVQHAQHLRGLAREGDRTAFHVEDVRTES